jgi:hypothetical protein
MKERHEKQPKVPENAAKASQPAMHVPYHTQMQHCATMLPKKKDKEPNVQS